MMWFTAAVNFADAAYLQVKYVCAEDTADHESVASEIPAANSEKSTAVAAAVNVTSLVQGSLKLRSCTELAMELAIRG